MLGAILGDIVGSPYEFDHKNIKTKEFPLFISDSRYTDDTVMTLAVAQAMMDGFNDEDLTRAALIRSMQNLGRLYPLAGYGAHFSLWLSETNPGPYNSWGNGSAMRVSSVAWAYDTLEDVEKYARISAEVTHNHPEGIKGAQACAGAIYLARTGHSKDAIKGYAQTVYEYDMDKTLDEIRPGYHHDESCQNTVPQALQAFLESTDFEDALRNAVSIGGDSDTVAAICGSIAEGFYGIPGDLREQALARLDGNLRGIIDRWDEWLLNKASAR
ncbi:MAG: ADP-ribosylglycohydrolase family protein [Actinobacteria bacterium]|nr:ADP-ribosylglycohydrolase family protein [Actinomycetota bacterium]